MLFVIIFCELFLLSLGLSFLFYKPQIQPVISMYHQPESRPLCRKVYVGNLANNGSTHEIREAFCHYGPIKKVWVARNPPGFAFVEFEDPTHAQNAITALDGTFLCGRHIKVAFAKRNARSSSRGQSRNVPTRNSIQGCCYACGERGHYVRDCFAHRIAMLELEDALGVDSSFFDSDDDMAMLHELYMDEDDLFYEYLEDYHRSRDGSSYTPTYSEESFNPNSRSTAQQQHRSERPQEQRRNDRSQVQNRSDEPQEQCRNNQLQEQSKSTPSCSPASNKTNNASDEVKCVICLDTVEDEMEYIPCGHGFHAKCCNEWLSISDICPVCRTEVGSRIGIAHICPVS